MKVRYICIVLAGFLAACGSDDDDGAVVAADPVVEVQQVASDLDGDFSLTAPATTDFAADGGACGDGSGTLILTDGVISGNALSTSGLVFDLNGEVDDDGIVTGGFALGGETVVVFEGAVVGTTGSGTWEDNFECMGTWEATLNP